MMIDISTVNWLAILVSAVINMVVGMVWYSPTLFANQWTKLIGKSMKDIDKKAAQKMYPIMFVAALISAFVLSWVVHGVGAMDIVSGALVGLLLWLGFIATTTISDYLFAGRPMKLYYINVGYYLVVMVITGALLAVWR